MSDAERKELNVEAGTLIQSRGISIPVAENTFDVLRENGCAGYAHFYLVNCYDDSVLINKAEIKIYKKLLEIDSKLGTTQTEQLFGCLVYSVRMDLIKVTESRYFLKFKLL